MMIKHILKDSKHKISLEKWFAKLELTVNELEDDLDSHSTIQQDIL